MKAAALILTLLAASACALKTKPGYKLNDAKCDGCKLGFSLLEEWIFSNMTTDFIKWGLGEICETMPDPYKTSCHLVINTDIDEIINMAKTIETPAEICAQIGACDGPMPTPDAPCAICKFLMTDIERWIKSGKTMDEIEKLLDAYCTLMPSSWQPACKQITDTGIEKIVELLLKFENPTVVCEQMTLCPGDYMSSMVEFGCEACELLFDSLENWVSMNFTETEIEWLFNRLCSLIPAPGKDICDRIIDMGIKEAIALLKEVESPYEICRQIGACHGPAPVDTPECHICKFLMGDIEKWVADGKTVAEIEKLVSQLCALMGESWATVCNKIADMTIEELIAMLVKYEGPAVVCQQITLCPAPVKL